MLSLLVSLLTISFPHDIYSLSATDIYGDSINFSAYSGKKILIVNTASASQYAYQYGQLEELYQLYKDSLVVIAFPSNDFSNEPYDESNIIDFVRSNYNVTYILGSITAVSGPQKSELYKFLAEPVEEGASEVEGDFQKFLINSDGKIVGVFAGVVEPMDEVIQNAIKGISGSNKS